jgi:hypothetical protein
MQRRWAFKDGCHELPRSRRGVHSDDGVTTTADDVEQHTLVRTDPMHRCRAAGHSQALVAERRGRVGEGPGCAQVEADHACVQTSTPAISR